MNTNKDQAGFCAMHGEARLSMWCDTCDSFFCIRCTSNHRGHTIMEASSALLAQQFAPRQPAIFRDPFSRARSDVTQDEASHALAMFRRTASASAIDRGARRASDKMAASQAALRGKLESMDVTLSRAKALVEEVAQFFRARFEGLTGDLLHDKIDEVFSQFDLDGGGTLDKQEFKKACELLGKRLSDDEVDILFSQYDADGSGEIEREEFRAMVLLALDQPSQQSLVIKRDEKQSQVAARLLQAHVCARRTEASHLDCQRVFAGAEDIDAEMAPRDIASKEIAGNSDDDCYTSTGPISVSNALEILDRHVPRLSVPAAGGKRLEDTTGHHSISVVGDEERTHAHADAQGIKHSGTRQGAQAGNSNKTCVISSPASAPRHGKRRHSPSSPSKSSPSVTPWMASSPACAPTKPSPSATPWASPWVTPRQSMREDFCMARHSLTDSNIGPCLSPRGSRDGFEARQARYEVLSQLACASPEPQGQVVQSVQGLVVQEPARGLGLLLVPLTQDCERLRECDKPDADPAALPGVEASDGLREAQGRAYHGRKLLPAPQRLALPQAKAGLSGHAMPLPAGRTLAFGRPLPWTSQRGNAGDDEQLRALPDIVPADLMRQCRARNHARGLLVQQHLTKREALLAAKDVVRGTCCRSRARAERAAGSKISQRPQPLSLQPSRLDIINLKQAGTARSAATLAIASESFYRSKSPLCPRGTSPAGICTPRFKPPVAEWSSFRQSFTRSVSAP